MTKEQLAQDLFTWANRQKAMIRNEDMRKKFAQRLKLQVIRILEKNDVKEPEDPSRVRGGCVTTVRKNKKASNAPRVLTEVESMKGDKNNPNA
jgi:hypothetical protein